MLLPLLFCEGQGSKAGLEVGYWGWDGRVLCTKTFALQYAALRVSVANNLGVICNGILGPKEYPLGGYKTLLFGTT